jgi:ATP-dependent helicase/nuclease subunit B
LRWDEVEIVTTDPDTYGIALDALCQRLDVGATMLHGVPLARTRLGRALDRWFAWLADGLPADVLRQALEAGELAEPGDGDARLPSTAIARELRSMKIGWGRSRYAAAVASIEADDQLREMRRRDDEPDEEFSERQASRRRSGAALAALLRALLDATPPVPERGSERRVRASVAGLARATLGWLDLVPIHGMAERQTAQRLRTRLERIAALEGGETGFASALAVLRDALADLRAWPLVTSERKPWSAAGGMVHLTDLAHAGTTGRARVFVVGLDAERAAGAGRQDPLLPDAARRAVAPGALATVAEHRVERAYALAAALSALRGRVTLSYATSGSLDGREAGPAPALLQAWRIVRGDASLSYEQLRKALVPPAAAVPARAGGALVGVELLDARDVWLDALACGALLLDGTSLVRVCWPSLDTGLRAAELAQGDRPTEYHGLVPRAAGALDPSRGTREISPSSLELLGKCPMAWFYRHGLKLYPPQDPEYDAEQWLDDKQRGELLHEVFEAFTRGYAGRQQEILGPAAAADMRSSLDEAIARWRERVPPPGEIVFEAEAAELRRAALAFLAMERDLAARGEQGAWSRFELVFGGGEAPGRYELGDGTVLLLRGRADRVDTLPDGSLRVVDYKTGSASRFTRRQKDGDFRGGRQLQVALYSEAVAGMLGAHVSRFEYRFPTERGQNTIVSYAAGELSRAKSIVASLLGHVRDGVFVPTTDGDDCAYCDYGALCGSTTDSYGNVSSARADWAAGNAERLDVYRSMLARRRAPEGAE